MKRLVISDRMFSILLLLIVLVTTIAFDIMMFVATARADAGAPALTVSPAASRAAVNSTAPADSSRFEYRGSEANAPKRPTAQPSPI